MTEYDQLIYNTWLAVTKKSNNKPYRLRKDFSSMDDETVNCVKNIARKLTRLNINPEEFFSAPYKLWQDTTHLPIIWYTKHKAITTWKKVFAN